MTEFAFAVGVGEQIFQGFHEAVAVLRPSPSLAILARAYLPRTISKFVDLEPNPAAFSCLKAQFMSSRHFFRHSGHVSVQAPLVSDLPN